MKLFLNFLILMNMSIFLKACLEDSDCSYDECCVPYPVKKCSRYLDAGEECNFGFRTGVFMN